MRCAVKIDLFVWDDDKHYSTNNSRFESLHWSLEVAASEATVRFPVAEEYEKLVWTYLYAKAWRGYTDKFVDPQIIAFLQDRINLGLYHPQEWDERIAVYDFMILHIADVKNLFGDGRIIPIYKIETLTSDGMDGLYFALDTDTENNFQIASILGYWPASHGYWVDEPIIEDHTGDGLPEIVVMPRGHSGSICHSSLHVMQWDGSQFVNLVGQPNGSIIGLGFCGDTWRFLPVEDNGSQSIQTQEFFAVDNSTTTLNRVFAWNQTKYVLQETIIQPISNDDPLDWIDYNFAVGEWETAVQTIEDLLAQWDTNLPPNVDPSYPDFLRFRQGWLYALNSQPENGRAVLQQLIDDPINPITPTLSLAAQAFLDLFQTDLDAYQACAAAQRVMLDALPEPSIYSAEYLAAWGYVRNDFPCNLSEAWDRLLEQTTEMKIEEAAIFLEGKGLQIVDNWSKDLNQDGQAELLFTIESPSVYQGATRKTWSIFKTEVGLQYVPLGFDGTSTTTWETALLQDGESPLHFVQVDETLHIIRFNIQEDEVTIQQFYRSELFYKVKSFALAEQDNVLMVTVDFSPSSIRFRQLLLRWNPAVEDFEIVGTDVPYYLGTSRYDLVEWAKVMLFEEERFENTAVMLSYFATNYEVELPETLYLLALAYELSGQEQEAVDTYWQLWRDFPESSFAVMAQRKLVPAEP